MYSYGCAGKGSSTRKRTQRKKSLNRKINGVNGDGKDTKDHGMKAEETRTKGKGKGQERNRNQFMVLVDLTTEVSCK